MENIVYDDINKKLENMTFKHLIQPIVNINNFDDILGYEYFSKPHHIESESFYLIEELLKAINSKSNLDKIDLDMLKSIANKINLNNNNTNNFINISSENTLINLEPVLFDNPKSITIELTEQFPINDLEKVKKKISEIKKLDIKIAVDDFGSGYSNLKLITEIEPDYVKFDKYFINKISLTDNKHIDCFSKIVEGLKKIGSHVVCEGVEIPEHILIAKQMNFNYVQGYYIKKPFFINE